ncbi:MULTISPECIES: DUF6628 family protein [Sphingomonas]|uniref:DUF6628 family protein n=1 Tax=Sphingomonas TaxID=13687 RepID=UPI0024134D93|nr:DUF6628 family protein [Sphingomonas echinoides]
MSSNQPTAPALAAALPHPLPEDTNARLFLFAFRRMGAHGLNDAFAAHALLEGFGAGFRRPLTLLRAMMADLAGGAKCSIAIAPCCCRRTTHAEHALLTIVTRAEIAPDSARLLLSDLIGLRSPDGILASICIVAQAFADAGRPITAE